LFCSQRLIDRNAAKLFSSNRVISHLNEACRIDELSRGSVSGPESIVNHGGRRSDAMQALTRCQHPVASSEAQNELHRAMRPASHRLIRMTIEIASI